MHRITARLRQLRTRQRRQPEMPNCLAHCRPGPHPAHQFIVRNRYHVEFSFRLKNKFFDSVEVSGPATNRLVWCRCGTFFGPGQTGLRDVEASRSAKKRAPPGRDDEGFAHTSALADEPVLVISLRSL